MRLALALLLAGAAMPAVAQSTTELGQRVDRVEKELRAVQRKVFPGGNPDYFEPQITAPQQAPASEGTPASTAVGDLTARVAALETQVRQLTNQSEVNNHRLDVLEQNYAKLQADTDFRIRQIETGGTAAAGAAPAATAGGTVAGAGTAATPPPFGPSGRKSAPAAGSTMGDQAQVDLTQPGAAPAPDTGASVAKTGDPAEDGYMAGYNLWSQKRYGEAETQLKQVVAKYPTSKRASYAQNLLGRAYMDDGQLTSAADAFLASYKKFPRGERAADSLYYLGVTLTKLKKSSQACQVFDEFRDVYGPTANATLKTRVTQARADAKCGA